MRKQKIEMIPPGRTLPVPETLSGEDMILTSIRLEQQFREIVNQGISPEFGYL